MYYGGASVSVTAGASAGYRFGGWSGATTDTSVTVTFPMPSSPASLTAAFDRCWPLTVGSPIGGTISARTPPNSLGCSANTYVTGTSISVTATADVSYVFDSWTGASTDSTESTTFSMPAAASTLSVSFLRCWGLWVSSPAGVNIGARTPDRSAGCTVGSYFAGTTISASLTVTAGYVFNAWTGPSTASTLTTSFTMPAAVATLSADVDRCWSLTLISPTGGTIGPLSPTSSAGCSLQSYVSGTVISVTATPWQGYVFSAWTGATGSTSASVSFAMPATSTSLGATFV
jgi:uncharacterized repeat protein (TIGR02543 family)